MRRRGWGEGEFPPSANFNNLDLNASHNNYRAQITSSYGNRGNSLVRKWQLSGVERIFKILSIESIFVKHRVISKKKNGLNLVYLK